MSRILVLLLTLSLMIFTVACDEDSDSPSGPETTAVSFATDIQPIFDNSCVGCHNPGGPASLLDLSSGTAYANLVNIASVQDAGLTMVVPGNSAQSFLFQKVNEASPSVGDRMPKNNDPLSAETIAKIKEWIDDGAKNN